MLQRLIAAVLGVLGLAAIALGVASATLWRADDTLTATARTAEGTTLLTTAPGVLEMGDPPVTISARADDGTTVVLAVGRDTDVAGWVGADPHTVVTGLSDWHTLSTDLVTEVDEAAPDPTETAAPDPAATATPTPGAEAAAPTPTPTPTPTPPAADPADASADPAAPTTVADPAGSDLWVDETTGDGSAELVWTPRDGRWTLLAAATGDPSPLTLQLSWPQTVTTPWLVPGVAGGAVLLLLALVLALRARRTPDREEDWYPVGVAGSTAAGSTAAVADADATGTDHRPGADGAPGSPDIDGKDAR